MNALGFISLAISITCYSIKELQAHGKLRWMGKGFSFWGEDSYLRKYKNIHPDKTKFQVQIPADNWYYNFFKVRYREAFPGSSTFFVFVTDGYHLMQFMFLLFLSLTITLFIGFNWYLLLGVWSMMHLAHFITYRTLQK